MKSYNIVFTEREKTELIEQPVNSPATDEILCKAERSMVSTGTETLILRGVADEGTNWSEYIT
jgi:hypothetical protein